MYVCVNFVRNIIPCEQCKSHTVGARKRKVSAKWLISLNKDSYALVFFSAVAMILPLFFSAIMFNTYSDLIKIFR